jgi:hypothetical protein
MEAFTEITLAELKDKITNTIVHMPYSRVTSSTLGGIRNASILFIVGIDKPETWTNGYVENSRYARFHVDQCTKGYQIECFTNTTKVKIRKATVASEELLIKKIATIMDTLSKAIEIV